MSTETSTTVPSLGSKNNSGSSGRKRPRTDCQPTEVAVEAVTSKGTKRKSSTEGESAIKKQRLDNADISEPTEVPVEAVTARGTKRKASATTEAPSKKQRGGDTDTNAGEPPEVSLETERKKEASAEQVPAPRTTRRESGCDPSPSSSGPSTSTQNNTPHSSGDFEAKYLQLHKLGQGGFGSVYAGSRKTDHFPVAIKHIPKADVESRPMVMDGKTFMVPLEVLLMLKAAGESESAGKSAALSLLDWYDLDQEVLLIMERPVPSVDLLRYLRDNKGPLEEEQAKNIMKQLVEAAIEIQSEGVFHRDLKLENVLVETGSDVPRVRVIDFGCGCFMKTTSYCNFSGTSAYAPPEFYLLGRYEADPTTVWELGALLYELLNGRKRFHTSKFLRTPVRFKSELRSLKVSRACLDFLEMCLAVNPKDRATLEQMRLHPWLTQGCTTN